MKKVLTTMVSVILVTTVLSLMFIMPISAASYATWNDHKFTQGIGSVTCYNGVNGVQYPYIQAAVEYAIDDWNWHLGLLNEQYGVNWNLVDFTGDITQECAMIEFYVKTTSEYAAEASFDYSATNAVANTILYGQSQGRLRNKLDDPQIDWSSATITFLSDQLEYFDQLEDLYELKTVANHEIGHALGLAHYSEDNGVLMYPYSDRTAEVPTAADLEGIYHLYG